MPNFVIKTDEGYFLKFENDLSKIVHTPLLKDALRMTKVKAEQLSTFIYIKFKLGNYKKEV